MEIVERQDAGVRALTDLLDDPRSGFTLEQRVRPLPRQATQEGGIGRVLQRVAGRHLGPVGLGEERDHIGRARLREGADNVAVEPLGHRETLLRGPRGGFEQAAPGERARALMHGVQHRHHAGDAGRTTAEHRLPARDRGAVGLQQHVGRRRLWRALPPAPRRNTLGRGVIIHQEAAPAHARALRLDQAKHDLNRDGGVGGAAAPAQHVQPGLHRERMRGGDEDARRGWRCGRTAALCARRRRLGRSEGQRLDGECRSQRRDQRAPHHCATASAPGRRGSAPPRISPFSIMIDWALPIVWSDRIRCPLAFSSASVSGLKLGSTCSVSVLF